MSESIRLKWGTLKGWDDLKEGGATFDAIDQYHKVGPVYGSCMAQSDNKVQKEFLCQAIDACDGEIFNDWSGEFMSKQEAKDYVNNYHK